MQWRLCCAAAAGNLLCLQAVAAGNQDLLHNVVACAPVQELLQSLSKLTGTQGIPQVWLMADQREFFKPTMTQTSIDTGICQNVQPGDVAAARCIECYWFDTSKQAFSEDAGYIEKDIAARG